jgi:alpha-tubulin suppressor-like RCC1 family protein
VRGSRVRVILMACVALGVTGMLGSARANPPGFDLTLSGPSTVTANFAVPYGGVLTVLLGGLPLAPVDALVDGQVAASTTTAVDGSYSVSLSLAPGSHVVQAIAFRGTALETQSPVLTATAVAPDPPILYRTTPASPSNSSTTPSIQGSAQAGSTVRLYTTSGCTGTVAGSGTASGAGTFSIAVTVTANSTTTFYGTASDVASNVSACSTSSITYTHDSIPPSLPTFTGTTPTSPSNTSTTPTIQGTAQAGSTVRLYTTSGCTGTVAGSGTAAGAGTFSIGVSVPANSSTTFRATATDVPGNSSGCSSSSINYIHDSVPPIFAGAASATADSETQITVSWTAATDNFTPSGSIVYEICRGATATECTTSFTTTATTSPGATSYVSSGLVQETRYFLVVRARDQVGNRDTNVAVASVRTTGPHVVIDIAAGFFHTCTLISDGTVRCWGYNTAGQLGNGTTTDSPTPVAVSGISGSTRATQIAAGAYQTCALISDGTVRCWGGGGNGALGNGMGTNSSTPVVVSGISGSTRATQIAAGDFYACALISDGTVRCWGANFWGQLGNGTTTDSSTPVAVSGISGSTLATQIAANYHHACALISDGTVRCWGENNYGQLGNSTTTDSSTPVVVTGISGSTRATQISAGQGHTCALISDGTVRCWGKNIGLNPVVVSGISGSTLATQIAAGGDHTCALISDGTVRCWGYNTTGQLGNGTTTDSPTPVVVSGISGSTLASKIAASYRHTCALISDGTARCWGSNTRGQLGDGTTANSSTPVVVSGILGPLGGTQIAAGLYHTCALISDGTVRCWGSSADGQLGDGTTTNSSTPVVVSGISGSTLATQITAGYGHTCALISDGTVRCWGKNSNGQLGNGTTTDSSTPVVVSGILGSTRATQIAGGFEHACALIVDGTVRCWGKNVAGGLGNGTTTDSSTPVVVSGISGSTRATQIAGGGHHTCALISDGTMRCWGYNAFGQLGNGTSTDSSTPVVVSGVSGSTRATQIGGGGGHTCALISDGTVRCWGANSSGQLGNGTTTNSFTPVMVSGISGSTHATQIAGGAGGSNATCALISDGTVRCWGDNSFGQLGNGTNTTSSTPVVVSGISGSTLATQIAGGDHTCALISDGTVRCWGDNVEGQLGNGTTSQSSTPVVVLYLP